MHGPPELCPNNHFGPEDSEEDTGPQYPSLPARGTEGSEPKFVWDAGATLEGGAKAAAKGVGRWAGLSEEVGGASCLPWCQPLAPPGSRLAP